MLNKTAFNTPSCGTPVSISSVIEKLVLMNITKTLQSTLVNPNRLVLKLSDRINEIPDKR
jgi:hypothetical protein